MVNQVIRKVKKFGRGGAYTSLPSDWVNQEVEIRLIGPGTVIKEINWKNIETLIEDKIESAKRGY